MYGLWIKLWTWFDWLVGLIVFNATFNNFSVISWRSVLLVEPKPEKTTDLSQVSDKLYHIMLHTSPWSRFELTTLVVMGTDCMGSCKSNYHTITALELEPHFFTKRFPSMILMQIWNFTFMHQTIYKEPVHAL